MLGNKYSMKQSQFTLFTPENDRLTIKMLTDSDHFKDIIAHKIKTTLQKRDLCVYPYFLVKEKTDKSYQIYGHNSLLKSFGDNEICYVSRIVSEDIDSIKNMKHEPVDKYWTIRVNYQD